MLPSLLAFLPQTLLPASMPAEAPLYRTVDVDRDGRPDLFLLVDGQLLLLGNAGSGQLVDRTAALGLDGVPALVKAKWRDVDADGWQDLVVLTRAGVLELYQNGQGGLFTRQVLFAGGETAAVDWQWLAFDADESLDLLVQTEGTLHVLLGRHGGSFEPASVLPLGVGTNLTPGLSVGVEGGPISGPPDNEGARPAPGPSNDEDRGRDDSGAIPPPPPGTGYDDPRGGNSAGGGQVSISPPDPVVSSAFCAPGVDDLASSACLNASSVPLLGHLFPLGIEFFIDSTGRVGMGTLAPSQARLEVEPDSSGDGIYVDTPVGAATAIEAISSSPGDGFGVKAEANSPSGRAVRAVNEATSGNAYAVDGVTRSPDGTGVLGYASSTSSGSASGVKGVSLGPLGTGVTGEANAIFGVGVRGEGSLYGVLGESQGLAGVGGTTDAETSYGLRGENTAASQAELPIAVYGHATSPDGVGIFGRTTSTGAGGAEYGIGIEGLAHDAGVGVAGLSHTDEPFQGVFPIAFATEGVGVLGWDFASSGQTVGVLGVSDSIDAPSSGVAGSGAHTGVKGDGLVVGVHGATSAIQGVGLLGEYTGTVAADVVAVRGISEPFTGWGVGGRFSGGYLGVSGLATLSGGAAVHVGGDFVASGGSVNVGIRASGTTRAGEFNGDVTVSGNLSKGGGSFLIDHPLDPENKLLYHSFVESPDMMNVYNGNVVLDAEGEAWVEMPAWFEALNRDFRYQLTCIGAHAPIYVAREMRDGRFLIAGGEEGLKVSWQVTGIRQDPYAEANRIPVEEDKSEEERGLYLHPEAYGFDQTRGIDRLRLSLEKKAELAAETAQRPSDKLERPVQPKAPQRELSLPPPETDEE